MRNVFKYIVAILNLNCHDNWFLSKHLPSANKAQDIIRQKIAKELEAQRIAGPFKLLNLSIL